MYQTCEVIFDIKYFYQVAGDVKRTDLFNRIFGSHHRIFLNTKVDKCCFVVFSNVCFSFEDFHSRTFCGSFVFAVVIVCLCIYSVVKKQQIVFRFWFLDLLTVYEFFAVFLTPIINNDVGSIYIMPNHKYCELKITVYVNYPHLQ